MRSSWWVYTVGNLQQEKVMAEIKTQSSAWKMTPISQEWWWIWRLFSQPSSPRVMWGDFFYFDWEYVNENKSCTNVNLSILDDARLLLQLARAVHHCVQNQSKHKVFLFAGENLWRSSFSCTENELGINKTINKEFESIGALVSIKQYQSPSLFNSLKRTHLWITTWEITHCLHPLPISSSSSSSSSSSALLPNPWWPSIVLLCFRKDIPIGKDELMVWRSLLWFPVASALSTPSPTTSLVYHFHERKAWIQFHLVMLHYTEKKT